MQTIVKPLIEMWDTIGTQLAVLYGVVSPVLR